MKRFNCVVAVLLTYVLCASALLQPVSVYAASAAGEGAGSVATEQSNSSEEADESEGPIESSDDESSIPLENVDKEQPVDISSSDDQPNDNPEQEGVDGSDPHVSVAAHVSNVGWLGTVSDGATAGTTGRSLSLEAVKVSLSNAEASGSIEVNAHVSGIGWQGWDSPSASEGGMTGQSRSIEALQFRLTGEMAGLYDVYYRVHASNIGWMGWAKDGEDAGTTGYGRKLEAVQVRLVRKGDPAPSADGSDVDYAFKKRPMCVSYRAHVAGIGWQAPVEDGATAGTTGRGRALEDLMVSLSSSDYSDGSSVQVDAHVSGIGWQGWDSPSPSEGGTTGQSRSVEALRFRLTGQLADDYDVWYRVHASGIGWMGWAKDGESAGTTGYGRKLEAVQVRLVRKGDPAPSADGSDVDYAFKKRPMCVSYRAHVAGIGWQAPVEDGATAGTTGRGRALEDLMVSLSSSDYSDGSSVQVDAHVSGIGWQGWDSPSPSEGGTTGQSRSVEALRFRLTGQLADDYDVWYRVHASGIGWMGWAKDGESAGTTGLSTPLEAVQVVLVRKGEAAPDSTSNAYIELPTLTYSTEARSAWQDPVGSGVISGSVGKSIPISALKASVESTLSGGISYQVHVSNQGWLTSSSDGTPCGSLDSSNSIQAIKVSLTGDISKYCDVWYRVHVDNIGWLGWTKNGSMAGSTGYGINVQAIQIKITGKGAAAPGDTSSPSLSAQPLFSANPMQKRIVDCARSVPTPGGGLCAEWVARVFTKAGFGNVHKDACDYYWSYCKYSSLNTLKVGMVIAVPSHSHTYLGNIYGHVCIYVGDNKIMDNVGGIRTMDLNTWLNYYGTTYQPKWGWYNNVPLA